jgi:hypothetical protein
MPDMFPYILVLSISGWLGAIAVIMIAGLSPEMKSKPPLIFKYPERERNVVLITSGVFLALAISTAIVLPQWLMNLPERFNLFQWTFGALGILMAVISFLILRYRKQPMLSFGWNKKLWRIGSRIGASLIFLNFFLSGSISKSNLAIYFSEESLIIFAFMLVFNIAWETALRGFLQSRVNAWLGDQWGWLATAAFASILMLPIALVTGTSWITMLKFTGHQFILGWIMKRTGHVFPGAVWAASFTWFTLL